MRHGPMKHTRVKEGTTIRIISSPFSQYSCDFSVVGITLATRFCITSTCKIFAHLSSLWTKFLIAIHKDKHPNIKPDILHLFPGVKKIEKNSLGTKNSNRPCNTLVQRHKTVVLFVHPSWSSISSYISFM